MTSNTPETAEDAPELGADSFTLHYRLVIEGMCGIGKHGIINLQKTLDEMPMRDLFSLDGPSGIIIKREVLGVEEGW